MFKAKQNGQLKAIIQNIGLRYDVLSQGSLITRGVSKLDLQIQHTGYDSIIQNSSVSIKIISKALESELDARKKRFL